MKPSYLVILSFFFAACSAPQKEVEETNEVPAEVIVEKVPQPDVTSDMPSYQFSFANLELNQHLDDIDLRVFKHYGEFYTTDFNIYRLDRIDYLAESYFIDDINLYFIDSVLVKIQAYLREDKTNEFLNKYGRSKIYISDYRNKKLLETESLLIKNDGKYRINDNIDYYKLKWFKESADIEYVVNRKIDTSEVLKPDDIRHFDDKRHQYKLTFQTTDYNNQLAWVKWESYKQSRGLVAEPADE